MAELLSEEVLAEWRVQLNHADLTALFSHIDAQAEQIMALIEARALAEALVIAHEGRIETLTAERDQFKEEVRYLNDEVLGH